jgi:hypothetical protein
VRFDANRLQIKSETFCLCPHPNHGNKQNQSLWKVRLSRSFSEMRTGCWEPDERGERGEQGEHAKNATFTTYPQESKSLVNKVNVARGILISRARRMPN